MAFQFARNGRRRARQCLAGTDIRPVDIQGADRVTDKKQPALYLDMNPDEALARFMQTDMGEVRELMERKKATRPKPGGQPKKPAKPTG